MLIRFEGAPEHMIEVIGEPNRPASVRMSNYNGNSKSSEKTGDVPKYACNHCRLEHMLTLIMNRDDVQELMDLVSTLRGFPSHASKDVYGLDTKVDFNTFEIQFSNVDDDPGSNEVSEIAGEQKDDFKRIVDSIEALARTFAKKDSQV